jgi:aldose 1-epimerase
MMNVRRWMVAIAAQASVALMSCSPNASGDKAGSTSGASAAASSATSSPASTAPSVTKAPFGQAPDGKAVDIYTLKNAHGVEVGAMTYGGIIVSFRAPDRRGQLDDIVLGYDSLAGYVKSSPYFGAIVGRYGNRIARGRFTLEGVTYDKLAINNAPNHLHGGIKGFDKVVWGAEPFHTDSTAGVVLTYTSPDGEEGYPGTLRAKVTYTLNKNDELAVDYEATTDKATPVNLTQHSYWNLGGAGKGTILDHVLTLYASAITPVDSTLIPTGEIMPVAGTPFDFRTPTAIGARIDAANPQIRNGKGYDHNFVLDRPAGAGLAHAAHVTEPTTGRTLDIYTTEPGVQFYSGNFLDGTNVGKGGRAYARRTGFALETQHYPDSPNKPNFPSTILRPGETYHSRTVFKVGVAPNP